MTGPASGSSLIAGRKFILFDFFAMTAHRLHEISLQMRVGLHELGSELIEETLEILSLELASLSISSV